MTRLELLINLTDAQDEYIDDALSFLGSKIVPIKPKPTRRVFRRVFTGLVAAIIILLSSFAVAMAASPEFREAVFSFFHIRTADVTEHSPVEDQELPIENSSLQENDAEIHVTVTRVKLPIKGSGANGLFRVCTDEIEYNQGSHYDLYTQQGGELVKLELHTVHATETRFGKTYCFDFDWASDGKNTAIGYLRPPEGTAEDGVYRLQFLPGRPEQALILLEMGRLDIGYNGYYPVLMDLKTGTVTDFAASIQMDHFYGVTASGYVVNGRLADLSLSDDLTRIVFRNPVGASFYGNLKTGELTVLDNLIGESPDGVCLAGNEVIVCWKRFGGAVDEEQSTEYVDCGVRIWRIPIDTMQPEMYGELLTTALANPEAIWHETETTGAGLVSPSIIKDRYLLDIDAERHVFVTDLANGERAEIEGFLWPETPLSRIECQGSPCGDRLLISEYDEQGELYRLTVLDFPRLLWITIDRENAAGGIEHWRTWFDNDRIMIDSDSVDENGRSTGESWYYLYDIGK